MNMHNEQDSGKAAPLGAVSIKYMIDFKYKSFKLVSNKKCQCLIYISVDLNSEPERQ